MKTCPQCQRVYEDATLNFCLEDGEWLVNADEQEPRTAILSGSEASGLSQDEASTRPQVHTTDQTAILPSHTGDIPAKPRRLDKRLLAAPVLLAVIVLGAFFGYSYFKSRDSGQINSIAVLPFQNRSEDADTDYLSDGLAESLIFRLTQLPDLKVSPASSVMRYKGKETDFGKIASELGVEAVMTGRLTKRGDNLNITVELVDVRNNKSLWGEQYERKMSDLLATQREIASAIVQTLQIKIGGNAGGATKKYTSNNEAYQLYLKGRYHFAKRTKVDMEKSVDLFQQATALDPNFALAYVGIAESYTSMPSYPYISPKEASPKSHAAIARALELDPELPEAHTVAAMIATTDEWDYAKAEREFARAIELGPNLAITHYRYGWSYLSPLGRHDEAIAEMKKAYELEPLSVQQGANYAAVLMYARRFDEAIEQARKAYELDPNHVAAQNWLCHALNAKGLYSEALEIGDRASTNVANPLTSLAGCLGVAYAKTGRRERSLEVIAGISEAKKTRYVSSYWIAAIYAALGDKNAAFAELETAFQNREWFLQRIKVDPYMDPLRDDPRYTQMLKRLNLPE
jgi:TolB-like protein